MQLGGMKNWDGRENGKFLLGEGGKGKDIGVES